MKDKGAQGEVNQHPSGFVTAISTIWDKEIEAEVMQEDEHDGII